MTEPAAPAKTAIIPKADTPPRRNRWTLWLPLLTLLLLCGLGAGGYGFGWPWAQQLWQRFEDLERQVVDAQAQAAAPGPDVAALARAAANSSVQSGLASLEDDWQRELSALRARQNAERAESVRQLTGRMGRLEDQMDRLLAVDRRAWLGQEAVFLTRLAGQRLLVARDVEAALVLLEQADALLRLSGLVDQVEQLQLEFEAPASDMKADALSTTGWRERASAGWQAALAKLSDYLIIRRRSDEIAQLMTPEWAALARQNIRMLIEQSQIAMLSANQPLFEQSLQRSAKFIALFAQQDADRVASIVADLGALQNQNIAPDLPDLTDTRSLLEGQVERLGDRTSP